MFSTLATSTAFDPGSDNDAPWFPSIRVETHGRDVTTFLTKLTVEFPVADGLLFPYLNGGGGLGRVMERYSVVVDTSPWIVLDTLESTDYTGDVDDGSFHFFSETAIFPRAATSELGLALLLGGGVDVRLWRGFAVGRHPLAASPLRPGRPRHSPGDRAGELSGSDRDGNDVSQRRERRKHVSDQGNMASGIV